MDTRDGEVTGELHLSNILNGSIKTLGGAIRIDVDEAVRRFDGVSSSAGLCEVIRSGD